MRNQLLLPGQILILLLLAFSTKESATTAVTDHGPLAYQGGSADECENWQSSHPEWIFCDAFESNDPLVSNGRYFEYVSSE